MIECKSLRDKIAFRLIRFGFRVALKSRTEQGYLRYIVFNGDTYTFESKEHRDLKRLFKTDDEKGECDNNDR